MNPLTVSDVTTLLAQPESETLDFKREQYALSGGSPQAKAALVKDILAFANTSRLDDATILVGVEEVSPGNVNIVGVTDHLKDANLQQLVNSKTNRAVRFRYEMIHFRGVELGALRIDREQPRPVYLRSDFPTLKANIVYMRHGSSTTEATPDEILQMRRLPIATLSSSNNQHPNLRQLAERWLAVFDNHDIHRSQIALILKRPDLVPAHFQSGENILQVLSDDLIEETCRLFNIRRAWLDGESDTPFDHTYIGGDMTQVVEAMVEMRRRGISCSVVCIKTRKGELCQHADQAVGALIETELMELNDRSIGCYLPFPTGPGFCWSNIKHRWYMKQLLLAARWLELHFFGWTLSTADMTHLGEGETFPAHVRRRDQESWYPDDYVYGPEESVAAKEIEDYQALMAYCQKSGFIALLRAARAKVSGLSGTDPEKHLLPR